MVYEDLTRNAYEDPNNAYGAVAGISIEYPEDIAIDYNLPTKTEPVYPIYSASSPDQRFNKPFVRFDGEAKGSIDDKGRYLPLAPGAIVTVSVHEVINGIEEGEIEEGDIHEVRSALGKIRMHRQPLAIASTTLLDCSDTTVFEAAESTALENNKDQE